MTISISGTDNRDMKQYVRKLIVIRFFMRQNIENPLLDWEVVVNILFE